MTYESLLHYYQEEGFNPVPIDLEDCMSWESHLSKRRNLYERNLGIPLFLLKDRSVLEFGCNSGENALVLASYGAKLTLVEPNKSVIPRLLSLFKKFGLRKYIISLSHESIEDFQGNQLYDVVIAEGFINTLLNRNDALKKLIDLVIPGGIVIISFDCRYGHLLEMTRKLVFYRACQLSRIDNVYSTKSLKLAKKLYLQEFTSTNASRPFEAWWKDVLLNPFVCWKYLWSYQEIIPLIEESGGEFFSSSPMWANLDSYIWYKNVCDHKTRHVRLLESWNRHFPYFLSGLPSTTWRLQRTPHEVIFKVSDLLVLVSQYIEKYPTIPSFEYPDLLFKYLNSLGNPDLVRFNQELKYIYDAIHTNTIDQLLSSYGELKYIRNLWGVPYHYLCFRKQESKKWF